MKTDIGKMAIIKNTKGEFLPNYVGVIIAEFKEGYNLTSLSKSNKGHPFWGRAEYTYIISKEVEQYITTMLKLSRYL